MRKQDPSKAARAQDWALNEVLDAAIVIVALEAGHWVADNHMYLDLCCCAATL